MGYWPIVNTVLREADIIIVLADARMPELSINEEVLRKLHERGKQYVLVFTKRDLVPPSSVKQLRQAYPRAFFVSGRKNEGVSALRRHLQIIGKRFTAEEPKVGVVGYPNVGKSALINSLARRARTLVTNQPGTTRGTQWVKTGGLCILDTPGVIPLFDKHVKLGVLGAKSPEKMQHPEKVAYELLTLFLVKDKQALQEYYGLESLPIELDVLVEAIGRKRGYLRKKGEVDEHRTVISIIQDWQSGKLNFR